MRIRSICSFMRLRWYSADTQDKSVVISITNSRVNKGLVRRIVQSVTGIVLRKVTYTSIKKESVIRYPNISGYVRKGVYLVKCSSNLRRYTLYFSSVIDRNVFLNYFTVVGSTPGKQEATVDNTTPSDTTESSCD